MARAKKVIANSVSQNERVDAVVADPAAVAPVVAVEKKPRKQRVMKKGESELMSARGIGMQFVRKEITPEGTKLKKAEGMKDAGSVYRALKSELEPLAREVALAHPNPDGDLTKEAKTELKKARESAFKTLYSTKFPSLIRDKHAELKSAVPVVADAPAQ